MAEVPGQELGAPSIPEPCLCRGVRRDPRHRHAQRPLHLPTPFDVGVVLLWSLKLALIKSLGKLEASVESLASS